MAQQTAVEWLYKELYGIPRTLWEDQIIKIFEESRKIEKKNIIDAMLHALDEDGHTGEWKIKFVNDYYDKTFGNE